MTLVRKISLAICALLCAVAVGGGISACGGKDETPAYGYGEEGTYYYTESSGDDLLTLRKGTYILTFSSASSSGTYAFSDGTLTLYDGDEETGTGTLTDSGISLRYGGNTYLFLTYEYYTVSFVFGGETLTTQSVLNGKAAQDPGDAEKDGYVFLGWYADSAYTTRYEFNTSITGNTTIYARFVEVEGTTEYNVTYDFGNGETYTTETLNGKIYDLPEAEQSGYTFLGWWVSATNNASELTYRYTDETLYEDTTLYAVYASGSYIGASIKDGTLTWLNAPASQMSVTVTDEEGSAVASWDQQATQTVGYDFTSLSSGKYTVEVTSGGVTETLTYVSNGLNRASGFTVISGSILMYSEVANAERYYITIDCGNPGHDHSFIDNGSSLYYDFSSCDMPADGITFTVYAYAEGYYYSVSSYNYFLGLDNTEVKVEGNEITWTPVSMAMSYEVYIDGNLVAMTSDTSYSLANYGTGTYEIAIRPVTTGYYSELSETISFTKITLASPTITGIVDYTISWTEVEGATGYIVSINGVETTISDGNITSLILSDDNYTEGLDEYEISVKAMAADSSNDSPYSDAITVTGTSVGSAVSYNNGTVTWQYSLSATEYRITVNDGDETVVTGTNSSPVTLTKSGNNEITIYFVNDDDEIYGTASITIYAYAIVFDARGGTAYDAEGNEIEAIYVAKGDAVTLPDVEYTSGAAEFGGWYTLPDLMEGADLYDYAGDGYLYEDGTVFTGNATIVLYAFWRSPRIDVRLEAGHGTVYDGEGNVVTSELISLNGTDYVLYVPETGDLAYAFYGWYTGENGTGTRYTDETGKALRAFDNSSVTTLYAYWVPVLSFDLTTYNGREVLSVSKGDYISVVSEVTIPATYEYNGIVYDVAVMGSSAFNSCSTLTTINIPDTMQSISLVNNGYASGAGAFASSSRLLNVNVYETGEPSTTKEITYYSEDGVLFMDNRTTGYVELAYYPQGRTDSTYRIPEEVSNANELGYDGDSLDTVPVTHAVTAVPTQVFRDKTVSEVIIPASVVYVDTQAFYYCTSVKTITFEGDEGSPLTVGAYAFQRCTALTDITLPARLASFNSNFFSNCSALANVNVSGNGGSFSSIDGVLCDAGGDEIIYFPIGRTGSYEIPSGVTTVGASAFQSCSVTSVVIPAWVTLISESAFQGCTKLTTLIFGGDDYSPALYIETLAFYGCTSLTSVTLPSNLRGLAAYSFGNCTKLVTVTYDSFAGATVEDLSGLEPYAFSTSGSSNANSYVETLNLGANVPAIEFVSIFGGSYLQSVNIDPGNESYSSVDGVVFNEGGTNIFYFPANFQGAYTIPDTVKVIANGTFSGKTGLTEITIPASVTEIADNAFRGCSALTKVTFLSPEGDGEPLTIGEDAFLNCTALVSIEIPARLTYLGEGALSGCTSLEEITVEEGSANFTSYYGVLYETEDGVATRLILCPMKNKNTTIVIYSTISGIDSSAFANNTSVREITFDGDVNPENFTIGDGVFASCTALERIELPYGITEISTQMFQNCNSLRTISVPVTVTYIGTAAFYGCTMLLTVEFEGERTESNALTFGDGTGTSSTNSGVFYNCTSLTSITLPAYTVMGDRMFYNCSYLVEATLSEGITDIPQYAFYYCRRLATVNILGDVTSIGGYAFYNCSALTSFTIPEGVTSLSSYEFYNSGLTTLYIPASLTSIGTYSLSYCQSLTGITVSEGNTAFTSIDGVLYATNSSGAPTTLRVYPGANSVTSITIPSTVTGASSYAFRGSNIVELRWEDGKTSSFSFSDSTPFSGCTSLKAVYLPSGMTTLGQQLFQNVTSLEYVYIPNTVTSIGDYTFMGCTSLVTVDFEEGGASALVFSDGYYEYDGYEYYSGTFADCTSLEELRLPDRTTYLGEVMCFGCTSLKEVYIGDSVTEIPFLAFARCSSLGAVLFGEDSALKTVGEDAFYLAGPMRITLPATVTTVKDYAFESSGLESITLNAGLKTIEYDAFYYCSALQTITIPSSVTDIGAYCFYHCDSLKVVTFEKGAEALSVGNYAFAYSGLERVEIPARVSVINQYTFNHCGSLKEVAFEEGSTLSSVGTYAFSYTKITTFTFPESSSDITLAASIFAYCYNLETVNLSTSVTDLGTALNLCYSITSITVAEGSTSYRTDDTQPVLYTYDGTEISKVFGEIKGVYEIPDGISTINANAFQNQSSMTGVVIPASVTVIGDYAFDGCISLVNVVFEDRTESVSVGGYAFENCKSLKTIDLSYATSYGTYVFYGCSSLEEVILSDSLTELTNYMFRDCTSLRTIDLPDSITYMGRYTFYGSGIEEITIPEGVTDIGISAGTAGSTSSSSSNYVYLFQGCEALRKVTLSSKLATIGSATFYDCPNLSIITYTGDEGYDPEKEYPEGYTAWPSSLTLIGYKSFYDCGFITLNVPAISSSNQGQYMFQSCESLKSVYCMDGLDSMVIRMFSDCTALEGVDFNQVTTINNYVFYNCYSLEYCDVSTISTLTGQGIFYNCTSLREVVWNPAVTTVPSYTFYGCSSLTTLDNFDKVTTTNTYAFEYSGITSMSVLPALTTIGNYTFVGSALTTADLTNITSLGTYAFQYCESLERIIFSPTMTSLPNYTFDGCTSLRNVTLPDYMTTLGNYCFRNCSSLITIDLSHVTSVGTYCFYGCSSLLTATLSTSSSFTTIPTYCFYNCSSLLEITIPSNVKTMNADAFYGCASLEEVTVPSTVTSFGNYMFYGCTSLERAYIRAGVTSTGTYCFYGCTSLEFVEFPDGLTTIGQYAFYGCTSLREIGLPSSLTQINGTYAFYGSGLEYVYIPAKCTTIYDSTVFADCSSLKYFEVDAENPNFRSGEHGELIRATNETILNWPGGYEGVAVVDDGLAITTYTFLGCAYITGVELPDSVTTIPNYCFEYCTSLESITFGGNVTTINQYAFAYSGLKTLTIPSTVTTVNTYAFAYSSLERVEIEGNPSMGTYAFAYCDSLAEVVFSDSFTTISNYMFYYDTALESVDFSHGVTSIGQYAFAYSGLKTVTIPETVATLNNYAFQYCDVEEVEILGTPSLGTYLFDGCASLVKVTMADGITALNSYMFRNCTSLREVRLPETLETISGSSFYGCTELESIVLPSSLTTIAASAFYNCVKLSSITLNDGLETINANAFSGCTGIESIYVPASVTSVAASAFAYWTADQTIYIGSSLYRVNAMWTSGWDNYCEATIIYDYVA